MKNLGNISPNPGSNPTRKRLGRGIGSGLGKTAGKGHKGQKARKSGGIRAGFEGGQTPLYRRLPKYGFKNPNMKVFQVLNLESLKVFKDGDAVTLESLATKGLIKSVNEPVKLLARGDVHAKLTIKLHKVSGSAKEKIVKAGGNVEEI